MDVAKIDKTVDIQTKTYGYLSLRDAIEGAESGARINLLKDITEDVEVTETLYCLWITE